MSKLKNPNTDPWFHASGAVRTGEVLGLGWEWEEKTWKRLLLLLTTRQCSVPGAAVTGWRYCDLAPPTLPRVELQTNLREDYAKFTIMENAPTRAFSWLKAATIAFTFKTHLRHRH